MIKYRIFNEKKKRFYRTFSKNYKTYDYLINNKILHYPLGCHDGQRKLLYSEIEFYTLLSKKFDLNDILVVYVGSGQGFHQPIIFNMFPELDFFMCDVNEFGFEHKIIYNNERFYFHKGYYDDETYKIVNKFNKKNKLIAFICDIREEPTELKIFENMISQQKWCIQLNSISYLLKFRLPYHNKGFKYEYFNYNLPIKLRKTNKEGFIYLDGKIMLQIYSPLMSTETRLMHIKKNINEKFKLKKYDIDIYNGNCYYFNLIDRNSIYKYKDSDQLKYHILGYDDGYESVCEYYIIEQYYKIYKLNNNLNNIIKMIYKINTELYKEYKNHFIYCSLKTLDKKIKGINLYLINLYGNKINKKNIKINDVLSIKYINKLQRVILYINDIKNSLKLQKKEFEKYNGKMYDVQIISINYYLKNIDKIYENFYKLYNNYKNINININKLLKEEINKKRENYKKNVPKNKESYFS